MYYADYILFLMTAALWINIRKYFEEGRLFDLAKALGLVIICTILIFCTLEIEYGDSSLPGFYLRPIALALHIAVQTETITHMAKQTKEPSKRKYYGDKDNGLVLYSWMTICGSWLGSLLYFLDAEPKQVFPCPNVYGFAAGALAHSAFDYAATYIATSVDPQKQK